MKCLPFILCGVLMVGAVNAATFVAKDAGVSLTLPDGWVRDAKSAWELEVDAPGQKSGVAIHRKSPNDRTLWDILNSTLASFEAMAAREASSEKPRLAPGRVVQVKPFTSASGIDGLRITSGWFRSKSEIEPNVYHYVFFNAAKKAVCVCVYASAGSKTPEAADALVLPGLQFTE